MIRYIEKPNLPEGRVSKIICGDIPKAVEDFFLERKIKLIKCERNTLIDPSVSTHADMCALHLGENKIVADKNQRMLIEKLRIEGFEVFETVEAAAGEYPGDIKLNIALFSKYAIGAFKYSDFAVIDSIYAFNKFEVKQGYGKCSVLPINDKALITDDASIYKTLKNTFDVLLTEKGDVHLSGHEYGFIGGASAKISKNEVLFFGDLKKHRNYKEIISFLQKYSCEALSFEGIPLTDVGGIVSLCEYI